MVQEVSSSAMTTIAIIIGLSPSAQDVAFSNVSDGPPPSGGSQTMNSQSPMLPPQGSMSLIQVKIILRATDLLGRQPWCYEKDE
ncbi:hypothetical protein TWF788_001839 [Orbilia oligospora]|uniref:Uncharacterized protein n=1 Tax=Orbilia oligospora TaxID=2813651 RepID=A0A7C8Q0Q4_ORBOL|nr:hypothetical protein TWF788_001839 [Orbilia oligospora]